MKLWEAQELKAIRQRAVHWYRKNQRDLPWRQTTDAYRIWISEIMLQQTVVATVIPYYEAFLADFPNVQRLANATEQAVLKRWAGLGYYRRAKQLHLAAKQIVAEHDGIFPASFEEILALPGIGRYTAGAIASFAYDQRRPIVEANTQRLYARLLRRKGQMNERLLQSDLWSFAESFLPSKKGSGETNQAMMEIGSQVCLPKNPKCDECPLSVLCPTQKAGEQALIPSPKPPKIYEERLEALVVVSHKRLGYLLRLCQPEERWAGLWDFPRFDISSCRTESDAISAIESQFQERFHNSIEILSESDSIKHGVTRYKITLRCFHARLKRGSRSPRPAPHSAWHSLSELRELPLSSTGSRIAKRLKMIAIEPDQLGKV